jgi:deoxyribose-phosphate aldolase
MFNIPLNQYIDHTLLKPEATQEQFETLLDEAIKFDFKAVCVSPYMAVPIRQTLNTTGHSDIKVCTVVGFPHGNTPLNLKADEVRYFVYRGIDEIDFVLNYGELKNRKFDQTIKELQTLSEICRSAGAVSKCIVETCYLSPSEKDMIFHYIKDFAPQLDYIKTSTGFGTSSAKVEDVARWKELRGDATRPLIKAAGGIKTLADAKEMIDAGADRLGMSAGVQVMEELSVLQNSHTHREETVEQINNCSN